MATPLTRTRHDGTPYLRPPDVEKEIDEVLGLPRAALVARFRQPSSSNRLKMGTLIHLCRRAHADGDQELVSLIGSALILSVHRCINNLIPKGTPNPSYVHGEATGLFAEALAKGLAAGDDSLDIYEVSITVALKRRVRDVLRRPKDPLNHSGTFGHASDPDEPADGDDAFAKVAPHFQSFEGPLDAVASDQLARAVRDLPEELRRAVLLVYRLGLKVESDDPHERTAATICGVSGRTIRNRLERARQQLSTLELS